MRNIYHDFGKYSSHLIGEYLFTDYIKNINAINSQFAIHNYQLTARRIGKDLKLVSNFVVNTNINYNIYYCTICYNSVTC